MSGASPAAQPLTDAAAEARRRRGLVAVIASTTGAGLTIGITYPLVSLVLERWGLDSATIGLNAAMPSLATLMLAPFLPRLLGRVGVLPALYVGIAVSACGLLIMGLWHDVTVWFVIRLLGGAGLVVHWIVSEAWVSSVVGEGHRGRVIALYTTLFSVGFAGGPLVLGLIGTEGFLPFAVAAGVIAASALPLLYARGAEPAMPVRAGWNLWQVVIAAPVVMLAAVVAGFAELSAIALLPLYGLLNGLGEGQAVTMLTALIAGSILLQLPLGWLGDRMDRRMLLLACAAGVAAMALLLPLAVGQPILLWPFLFLWGGGLIGLYTLSLTLLGARFQPGEMAAANAAFIALYECGGLAGPSLVGGAMAVSAGYGMPVVLAAVGGAFALFGLMRRSAAGARSG